MDHKNDSFLDFREAPFDSPDGDVYVRSTSSRTDFLVFQSFLTFSSPDFWRSILQLQTVTCGTNETKNDHPIIPLEEPKEVIELLLRFTYPPSSAPKPTIASLTVGMEALKAANKYRMDAVEKLIREELFKDLTGTQPLSLFALACHHGLETEMKMAAKRVLGHSGLECTYVEELELITGGVLHRLQEYHSKCSELASSFYLNQASLPPIESDAGVTECSGCGIRFPWVTLLRASAANGRKYEYNMDWWRNTFYGSASRLIKAAPAGATLRDPSLLGELMGQAAATCSHRGVMFVALQNLLDRLGVEVDRIVDSVELKVQAMRR
ncbi:hypothetical protein D9758_008045 [Tetrapyrgos nigripes]|uniref:BTB domain-containing protein n=1 Tax=Tetrapyrgos nigripes TaxID=182062 RepID=A0A8H5FVJ6_9AGAR|nr:hypothetical protein D9758_008045 [Tetrapyrgos nigripes]